MVKNWVTQVCEDRRALYYNGLHELENS